MDSVTLWARALWKAAIPCTLITLALGAITTSLPVSSPGVAQTADLSTDLETTLMASVSLDNDFDW